MDKNLPAHQNNYGVLTEVSKGINRSLGDTSERTVSRRTAHGLKNTTGVYQMDDDAAEVIIHLGMILSGLLLCLSIKDRRLLIGAAILIVILILLYQAGKNSL